MKLMTALLGASALCAFGSTALADGHEGERGRDGEVKIIYWQAPSILNPYLSGGTKDIEAASLVIEPLARYDENGNLVPWLVDEIPTVANGGVSEDLTQITWKITPGLVWSDGSAFTSADAKFTYEYCSHPEGGCAQLTKYEGVSSVETPDELTVVVTFEPAAAKPVRSVCRQRGSDRSSRAVRRLSGGKGTRVYGCQLRPDRHWPLHRH